MLKIKLIKCKFTQELFIVSLLGDNEEILRANTHTLLSNTKELGLEVNINKTKYMVTDRYSLYNGNGQLTRNEGNFEEVAEFKYLGTIITNRNEMHKEIKHRLNSGNACYYALQGLCHPNFSQKTLNSKYIKRLFSQLYYMDAKHGLLL